MKMRTTKKETSTTSTTTMTYEDGYDDDEDDANVIDLTIPKNRAKAAKQRSWWAPE